MPPRGERSETPGRCPGGTLENSPAFQRRVGRVRRSRVPEGRLKYSREFVVRFSRAYGTNAETLRRPRQ